MISSDNKMEVNCVATRRLRSVHSSAMIRPLEREKVMDRRNRLGVLRLEPHLSAAIKVCSLI
jgi:hypothetical protein